MTTPAPFDPLLDLRAGVTLIEASAGTGKTYNIANLCARLVAEQGVPLHELLVVTFTRAATSELRDRVRARLADAERAVEATRTQGLVPADRVLRWLCRGDTEEQPGDALDPCELELRAQRLRAAVRDFDTAAVFTIHGFCQRVLQQLAFESNAALDAELLEQLDELCDEVVDDFVVTATWGQSLEVSRWLGDAVGLSRRVLGWLARAARDSDYTRTLPEGQPPLADVLAQAQRRVELGAAFLARWREELPFVGALVEQAARGGVLNGNAYRKDAGPSAVAQARQWLERGALPWPGMLEDTAVRRLRADHLRAKTNKGQPTPTHPFFGAWQSLTDEVASHSGLIDDARGAFLGHARHELDRRLGERGSLGYDDLLRTVCQRLCEPGGEVLAEALRARYRAALVDEFQDTDAVQWEIFRRVFAQAGNRQLYLIGDPKQAIYRFRGADVFVYAHAAAEAPPERRFTMLTNHRSDGRLVRALHELFGGESAFGRDFLGYPKVGVPAGHERDRLLAAAAAADEGAALRAALELRWFDSSLTAAAEPGKALSKQRAEQLCLRLAAAEVVRLLDRGLSVVSRDRTSGEPGAQRPLRPSDVAILVRTNRQVAPLRRALLERGLAAVVTQAGSVWASDEARAVQTWLEAVAEPGREGLARRLALSPLGGWSVAALHRATSDEEHAATGSGAWASLRAAVARAAERLEARGFAVAFEQALAELGTIERLAELPDGERRLTDLRHVAELLHREAQVGRLGAAGLARRLAVLRHDDPSEEQSASLRLESDADAVKICTVHKSKGLQFPVVLLPTLWSGLKSLRLQDKEVLRFHDDEGRACCDVRRSGAPGRDEHEGRALAEAREEAMRLAYVALTRAEHLAVVWWGAANEAQWAALGPLLHGRGEGGRTAAAQRIEAALAGDHSELLADLTSLARAASPGGGPLLSWSRTSATDLRPMALAEHEPAAEAPLAAAAWPAGRRFDESWRRWSYTALTRGREVELARAQALPLAAGALLDEQARDRDAEAGSPPRIEPGETDDESASREQVPLAHFQRGADAGSYVHKVLELIDFRNLRERQAAQRELSVLLRDLGLRFGVGETEQRSLAAALPAIVDTPLGGPLGELRLRDVGPPDRLDELSFDLPLARRLADGAATASVDGARFAAVLAGRTDAPYPAGYAAALRAIPFGSLAGMLTGAIDLVLRAPDGRFWVVDYKTNWLGTARAADGAACSCAAHYAQPWLAAAMAHHNYFVQYQLYLVALHRYLRARIPGYHYEHHVGGAAYLFLRGMLGPRTPRVGGAVHGVFVDRPARDTVEALSATLEGDGP